MAKSLASRVGHEKKQRKYVTTNPTIVNILLLIALTSMLVVVAVSADYSNAYGQFGDRYYGMGGGHGLGPGYNYHHYQGGHNGRPHHRPNRYGYRWYQG